MVARLHHLSHAEIRRIKHIATNESTEITSTTIFAFCGQIEKFHSEPLVAIRDKL